MSNKSNICTTENVFDIQKDVADPKEENVFLKNQFKMLIDSSLISGTHFQFSSERQWASSENVESAYSHFTLITKLLVKNLSRVDFVLRHNIMCGQSNKNENKTDDVGLPKDYYYDLLLGSRSTISNDSAPKFNHVAISGSKKYDDSLTLIRLKKRSQEETIPKELPSKQLQKTRIVEERAVVPLTCDENEIKDSNVGRIHVPRVEILLRENHLSNSRDLNNWLDNVLDD